MSERRVSVEVDGHLVSGLLRWDGKRGAVYATAEAPYAGETFRGQPRLPGRPSKDEPRLFTPSGEWTKFLIDYGTILLTYSFKAARKRLDPRHFPGDSERARTWPDLGDHAANAAWVRNFLASPGVKEVERLAPNGVVHAGELGLAIVDYKKGLCDFLYSWEMAPLAGVPAAVNFLHWREFASLHTYDVAGRLLFDVVMGRVGVVSAGPWRESTIRFWWNRVHEARKLGIFIHGYDASNGAIVDPNSYLNFRPSDEDWWDVEKDHGDVHLLFSKEKLG
jgi:hypothetical protein